MTHFERQFKCYSVWATWSTTFLDKYKGIMLVHQLGTCMYCTWNLLKIFVLLFILFITNSKIEQDLLFFSVRLICEDSTPSVSE